MNQNDNTHIGVVNVPSNVQINDLHPPSIPIIPKRPKLNMTEYFEEDPMLMEMDPILIDDFCKCMVEDMLFIMEKEHEYDRNNQNRRYCRMFYEYIKNEELISKECANFLLSHPVYQNNLCVCIFRTFLNITKNREILEKFDQGQEDRWNNYHIQYHQYGLDMKDYYQKLDEYHGEIEKRVTDHICDETLKKYEAPVQPLDQNVFEFISAHCAKKIENIHEIHKCMLCMENMEEGDDVIQLPLCGHHFHFKSMNEKENQNNYNYSDDDHLSCLGLQHYFQYKNDCPVCRCEIIIINENKNEDEENVQQKTQSTKYIKINSVLLKEVVMFLGINGFYISSHKL